MGREFSNSAYSQSNYSNNPNQQNFTMFNQARAQQFDPQNASSQDLDMYKRLKRLEKFDSQARDKAKQSKPKLLQNSSGVFNGI